jgi:hypothetical protein
VTRADVEQLIRSYRDGECPWPALLDAFEEVGWWGVEWLEQPARRDHYPLRVWDRRQRHIGTVVPGSGRRWYWALYVTDKLQRRAAGRLRELQGVAWSFRTAKAAAEAAWARMLRDGLLAL